LPNSLLDELPGEEDFAGNPCLTSTAHNRCAHVDSPKPPAKALLSDYGYGVVISNQKNAR
jgi:hypothetical protein